MLFASLLVAAAFSQCTKVTTRYEVHDMTEADIKIFRETIRTASTTPDPDSPNMSIWEAGVKLHESSTREIHVDGTFFYWHRLFLRSMEEKLQEINPQFYFPYWDSSKEWNTFQNSLALKITDMSDTNLGIKRDVSNGVLPSPESFANHFQNSINTGEGFGFF